MSSKNKFFKRYQDVVDKYGFNVTPYKRIEPFVGFLFRHWFCVKTFNIENVPAQGSCVLFGNHSGGLPVDALLLYDGIINQHPEPRRARFMVTKILHHLPVIGKFLRGFGCIPPDYEITVERLRDNELVAMYPEAEKGTGKLFKDRYKLVDFHSGFVRAAIETQSAMVPVVTIGGEEIYPIFADVKPIAKMLKWPYYPLTPFFPWLPFPFYAVPLPSKILICVLPQFKLKYPPEAAKDEELVEKISRDIRSDLQARVNDLLSLRKGPFIDWDLNLVRAYLRSRDCAFTRSAQHQLEG